MTIGEVIEWLDRIKDKYIHGGDEGFDNKRKEAIDMAIEALNERAMTREEVVKKKGDYLDCHSCVHHSRLYDRHGVATGHWCSARNGRLKKRFRGECNWINAKATCEGKSG